MRKTSMTLNLIVAVFFLGFLGYTFFAKQHLQELARAFVTEKTVKHSKPVVDVADEAMNSPLVSKFLSEKQEVAIRHEIAEYNQDANAYIADLTRQKKLAPKVKNPNPLLKKVMMVKEKIRAFYDNTLASLIKDLRIFSISNVAAALIAFTLAYRSRERIQKSLVIFSFAMFFLVLLATYMYIDDLTFFRILFRCHMGSGYPVFLCVVIGSVYFDYFHKNRQLEELLTEVDSRAAKHIPVADNEQH